MSAGIQPTKGDFDARLGSLSLQTITLMNSWNQFKSKVDTVYDGQLAAMGYSRVLPDPISAPAVAPASSGSNTLQPGHTYYVAYAWGLKNAGYPAVTLPSAVQSFTTSSSPTPETLTIPSAPQGATAIYVYVGDSPTTLTLNLEFDDPNTTGSNSIDITGPSPADAKAPMTRNTTGDVENIRNLMANVGTFLAIFTGAAPLTHPQDFTQSLQPFAGMGS